MDSVRRAGVDARRNGRSAVPSTKTPRRRRKKRRLANTKMTPEELHSRAAFAGSVGLMPSLRLVTKPLTAVGTMVDDLTYPTLEALNEMWSSAFGDGGDGGGGGDAQDGAPGASPPSLGDLSTSFSQLQHTCA